MSAQHTPGPWNIEWAAVQGGDGNCIVDNSDMQEMSRIASVFFHDDSEGETAANTRLIAAAPDLLAALQTTEANLRSWQAANPGINAMDAWLATVQEAIAQATGSAS